MLVAVFLSKERFTRQTPEEESNGEERKRDRLRRGLKQFNFARLRELKFVFLVAGAFFAELALVLTITYFPTYATAQGVSESSSYLLVTVWNATGILGRLLPGYALDFWGRFNMNVAMLACFNICLFALWLPFGSSLKVLYAYAALGGYFLGAVLSLLPACLSQIALADEFGEMYSIINGFLSIGNLVGVPIGASVINKGTVHDYDMFAVLTSVLSVTGTIFWYLSRFTLVGAKLNVKV